MQADELRRQAEASLALVGFQRTAELRSEMQERLEAMEQKLLNTIDIGFEFGGLGPVGLHNEHPIDFFEGSFHGGGSQAIKLSSAFLMNFKNSCSFMIKNTAPTLAP